MTNREINEYIAEHLFGIKYDYNKKYWLEPDGYYCNLTDYIKNYQQVIDYIAREVDDIQIYQNAENGFVCVFVNWVDQVNMGCPAKNFEGIGTTLGEAICRAAVEYLKNEEIIL